MELVNVIIGGNNIGVVSCDTGDVDRVVGVLMGAGVACCSDLDKSGIASAAADCIICVDDVPIFGNGFGAIEETLKALKIEPMRIENMRLIDSAKINQPKPVYKDRYAKRHYLKNSW